MLFLIEIWKFTSKILYHLNNECIQIAQAQISKKIRTVIPWERHVLIGLFYMWGTGPSTGAGMWKFVKRTKQGESPADQQCCESSVSKETTAATKVSTCARAPVKTSAAESWKKQHEWLDWKVSSDKRSVDVLFCSVCKAFVKDKLNNFVQGCRNIKGELKPKMDNFLNNLKTM